MKGLGERNEKQIQLLLIIEVELSKDDTYWN